MANKESIMSKTAAQSRQQEPEKITPEQAIKCKAYGCPMNGSMNMGGEKWSCIYHIKGNDAQAPLITKEINALYPKYKTILKAAHELRPEEFDSLQLTKGWDVDPLFMPVAGENFASWQHRIKQTVHKALMQKVNKVIDDHEYKFGGKSNGLSKAVRTLSGEFSVGGAA